MDLMEALRQHAVPELKDQLLEASLTSPPPTAVSGQLLDNLDKQLQEWAQVDPDVQPIIMELLEGVHTEGILKEPIVVPFPLCS
jgi:hypothetical protein